MKSKICRCYSHKTAAAAAHTRF